MPRLEIVFDVSGTSARFLLDHAPIGDPLSLDEPARAELRELMKQVDAVFEKPPYFVDPGQLHVWGQQLFGCFLAPIWPHAKLTAGSHCLAIQSTATRSISTCLGK